MQDVKELFEAVLQTDDKEEIVTFISQCREELSNSQIKKLIDRYKALEAAGQKE